MLVTPNGVSFAELSPSEIVRCTHLARE